MNQDPQLTRKLLTTMGHGCWHRVEFIVIKVVSRWTKMWERGMGKARTEDLCDTPNPMGLFFFWLLDKFVVTKNSLS